MRRKVRHGKLTVTVKGPREAVEAFGQVELTAHEQGAEKADRIVEAIGAPFASEEGEARPSGRPTRWRQAVLDPDQAPRLEVTVFE